MSLSTAFLFSCLFILYKTEATPTASLNATTVAPESATTSSKKDADASKKDVEVESVSGDAYVDSLSKSCQSTKDIATCVQYRALKFVHGMTSPYDDLGFRRSFKFTEFSLFGPLKLVALPPQEISTSGGPLFEESKSRSTDNELMKIFRFSLREVERFMRSYAFTIDIPTVGEDSSLPRIIDEDFFSGTLKQVAGRDKKKTLLFLLPLISFFHLKALLVPILLAVLFIKKLLVLGVIFLPSLLSLVKLCKPMHHHHVPWFSEPEPDYHSEYVPHYEAYKSRHGGGQGKRPEKHGEHHGSGPERNRYPETWNSPAPPPPPHQASTSQGWGDSVQKPISYVQQSSGGEASTNQVWGESNQKPISYVQQSSGEPSTNQAWSESNQKPINYVQQSSGGGTVTPSSRIDDSIDAGASPTRQRSGWNYGHRHQTWEHARDEEVGRGWNRVQSNAPYPWNRDRSDSREVKWDKEPNSGDSELENLKNFLSNFATNGHTNINQLIKTANDENLGDSYADSVVNSHNYYREKYETAESKRKKEKCDHDDPKESNKDLLPPMPEIRGNYSEFKTYMSS